MNIEKLKRLQSQVRIGGKGTPRRKKKVMHQTAAADDKKLQSSLKKLSVSTIPGIEEVNIIRDDLTVIHFNNPKAQASLSANTFAVTGHGETKKIVEMLPEILPQLGQETVVQLRMFANSMTKNQKDGVDGFKPNLLGGTDEDDVPLLVNDFDEIAKKEDLNIGQMQRSTKGLVLNADIINTRESAALQSTEKYANSDNKATDNATAVSLIEALQTPDDNVKMEVSVKKDNTKKSEKIDNTNKTTIPSNLVTAKENNVKKLHTNLKNKVTDLPLDILEPLKTVEYNEEKDADVKEAVKKNTIKTTDRSNSGTTVKEVNINKESTKPNNKVIDAAPSSSQYTTADPLKKEVLTSNNNMKTDVNFKKDNSKKSEKNNIKKKTEPGYPDIGNVKEESTKPKNKVTVAVASSTFHQQNEKEGNECKKLLPKELEQDVIKKSSINIGSSLQAPTKQENAIVAEPKDNQPMISNVQPNKNQTEQKFELNDQINLINNFDDSISLTDSNVGSLEIGNKAMQKEMENVSILSFENNMRDEHVAVASIGSSCNPEESVEKLKDAAKSTCLNEELQKENIQEIQDIRFSINTLENTIKNVSEIKDDAHPAIALLSLDSLKEKIELDEKLREIIAIEVITKKYDVKEVDGNSSTKSTQINENQELQNEVIPTANLDANLSLEEKKTEDQQHIDLATVSFNQLDPLQTIEIKSEKVLPTALIDIEKQIKDVEIAQDPTAPLQFVQENKLETKPIATVFESLQNIKIQPSNEPILENAKTIPKELAKQNINDNIKPQIYVDLTAKSTMLSPSQKTNDPNTVKPQHASPMKSDPKKPDPGVRPKQVSPAKSHAQLSLSTGTTPKTQQSSKSTTSRTSAKQEKSSVAPKAKQTLSTSAKSQASATASKPSTTQPKKTSAYPPSSDSSLKNSVAIKASSAPEMSQVTAPSKPRVDSNHPRGIKKTTVQQKISEDPPKPSQ